MSHENQIVNKGDPRSRAASVVPVPSPRVPITIRPATLVDLPVIDGLQKQYNKQLGFFPRAQMEGYIRNGWVMVAEENRGSGVGVRGSGENALDPKPDTRDPKPELLGYIASRDRYLKRDELGAIFQLCVAPGCQRKFVGMALLRHVFDQAPYGCRLYCCWCAQDIEANRFWEAMGFVPLAFRAGSATKSRVHIFWQRRIRQGDATTPYWFPAQTGGGSIREDRLVLPIPPGRHWSDEMPRILPKESAAPALPETKRRSTGKMPLIQKAKPTMGRLQFAIPKPPDQAKPRREPRQKQKNDPRLVAAARELRDRWLEKVNEDPAVLQSNGKYELSRLPEPCTPRPPLLEAA